MSVNGLTLINNFGQITDLNNLPVTCRAIVGRWSVHGKQLHGQLHWQMAINRANIGIFLSLGHVCLQLSAMTPVNTKASR